MLRLGSRAEETYIRGLLASFDADVATPVHAYKPEVLAAASAPKPAFDLSAMAPKAHTITLPFSPAITAS